MVELLVTGGLVIGAVLMMNRRPQAMLSASHPDAGTDLPCPWCHADTSESDARCPGCGQVFG
jgi:hypothetical protein